MSFDCCSQKEMTKEAWACRVRYGKQGEIEVLRELEEIVTENIKRFQDRPDMITEMRLAEAFLVAVSRKRVLAEIEVATLQ